MIIRNTSSGTVVISDLPGAQSGEGLSLAPGASVTIYNQEAQESLQLASLITAGIIANMGSAEPSAGTSVAMAEATGNPSMELLAAIMPVANDNKFFFENGLQLVENAAAWPMTVAGSVLGFAIGLNQATAAGSSMVFTIRKNGADTAMTMTIGAGVSGVVNSTGGPVAFAVGDRLSIHVVANAVSSGSSLMPTVTLS